MFAFLGLGLAEILVIGVMGAGMAAGVVVLLKALKGPTGPSDEMRKMRVEMDALREENDKLREEIKRLRGQGGANPDTGITQS